MKLAWEIEKQDVETVRAFYATWANDPFVRLRRTRNIEGPRPPITKEGTWMALIGCLLTTQQRSGPKSTVKQFLDATPFPLNHRECCRQQDLQAFAAETLLSFGCKRRILTIPQQIRSVYQMLEDGLWVPLLGRAREVSVSDSPSLERSAVHWVRERFKGKGIGPKQSRNLLQWIGASKYEIPIDSRITKWLNNNILKDRLSGQLLTDDSYADLVSDGVQLLCERAGIYPCLLDAAVFASFDGGWGEDDLIADSLVNACPGQDWGQP
jgi:hypothetical protein